MAAWWAAGDDLRAMTGPAVTRPAAAVTETSSAPAMESTSNRDNQSSRAAASDFMLK
jgi:hypothetical protein